MAIDLNLIDKLLADYKKPEDIIGEQGLLKQLTKAYASYCTSCEPRTAFSGKRRRLASLTPWALRGGSGPAAGPYDGQLRRLEHFPEDAEGFPQTAPKRYNRGEHS
jgi:hypothetical protein